MAANAAGLSDRLSSGESNSVHLFWSFKSIILEDPLTYPVSLLGPQQVDVFEAAAPAGSITLTGALDENNCFNGTGVCFDQLSYPSRNKSVALQLDGDVLTPINFMSAVNPGAGKWYADEIVWTRVN